MVESSLIVPVSCHTPSITTAQNTMKQEDSASGGPRTQRLPLTTRLLASLSSTGSTPLKALITQSCRSMASLHSAKTSLTLAASMLPSSHGISVAALVESCQFLQTSQRNRHSFFPTRMHGAGSAHQRLRLKPSTVTLTLRLQFVSW